MLLGGPQIPLPGGVDKALEQIALIVAHAAPSRAVLDTALLYQAGVSEEVLGAALRANPALLDHVEVHTKADPSITPLSAEGIREQLDRSLRALGVSCVQVLYLHSPDTSVALEESLGACEALRLEGKLIEVGLSNYPAWAVMAAHSLCRERGWAPPSVYQGVYHLFSRAIEYELVPALRALGMRLNTFSPLCGGMLSGRYSDDSALPSTGRFSAQFNHPREGATPAAKTMPVLRYWKPELFEALALLRVACEADGRSLMDVALSWLKLHSKLRAGDAVIFSGSSTVQCAETVAAFKGARVLSQGLLEAISKVATVVYPVQVAYFRGFDPVPGRSDRWLAEGGKI
jgi:aflatoxin B1 aldehyde reductase